VTSDVSKTFQPGTWLAILDIVRRAEGFPNDIESLMKNAYYTSLEEQGHVKVKQTGGGRKVAKKPNTVE